MKMCWTLSKFCLKYYCFLFSGHGVLRYDNNNQNKNTNTNYTTHPTTLADKPLLVSVCLTDNLGWSQATIPVFSESHRVSMCEWSLKPAGTSAHEVIKVPSLTLLWPCPCGRILQCCLSIGFCCPKTKPLRAATTTGHYMKPLCSLADEPVRDDRWRP